MIILLLLHVFCTPQGFNSHRAKTITVITCHSDAAPRPSSQATTVHLRLGRIDCLFVEQLFRAYNVARQSVRVCS